MKIIQNEDKTTDYWSRTRTNNIGLLICTLAQRQKQHLQHQPEEEEEEGVVVRTLELCTTAAADRSAETLETPTQLLLVLVLRVVVVASEHLHQNSASWTTNLASIDHRLTITNQVAVAYNTYLVLLNSMSCMQVDRWDILH